jgi:tRNA threonylcarbamoyl adenosine modification protein YeaZ
MRILAIDCATEACSVALFEDNRLVAREHQVLGRGHAEYLVPMIERLPELGKAGRIAVSLGPGSFTGVRIGLAAARALGIAWKAEVLGYPTLALVAAIARERNPTAVTVCMTGGHGEWFLQDFDSQGLPENELASVPIVKAACWQGHKIIAGSQASALSEIRSGVHEAFEILPDAAKFPLLPPALLTSQLRPLYGRAPDARISA